MSIFNDNFYTTSPVAIVYGKKDCVKTQRMVCGLDIIDLEYKIYYLDKDFTLDEFRQTFGENETLPKIIRSGARQDSVPKLAFNSKKAGKKSPAKNRPITFL